MRVLADSNIVAQAVRAMRDAGHDVVYIGERAADPGDEALLAEAVSEGRVFLTKDHDIGALPPRDLRPHRLLQGWAGRRAIVFGKWGDPLRPRRGK
jgi:predicted nuclease of predicted toxin-antitoxin system